MDNEKYGIELELITNKFKQKMQEVKNAFKGVDNKKINVNANTAQIEYIKSQIKEIQYLLKQADKGFEVGDTLKLEAKLEKLNNQYNKLISSQDKLNVSSSKATTGLSKGLDKMTGKIKRFGLALLSVRSIFSLVSRASSAYLSQDTELANKLQSAWVGLGAILAPIINFITTLILKLVSVINSVIKALTGVDLIAKASAKSMKSAAGSAKSLTKALAGFDELQNLDSDTSGGGGIGGFGDAFANIDADWSKMMNNIYEGIDKFKVKFTKMNLDMIEENKKVLEKAGFSKYFIKSYEMTANGALEVMNGFVDGFKGILLLIDGILSGDQEKIKLGIKTLASGIWQILTGLKDMIIGLLGMLISGIIQGVINLQQRTNELLWQGIQWIYEHTIAPIENWIEEKIRKPIKEKIGEVINWAKGQFEGWKNNIRTFINTVWGWFTSMWNGIKIGAITAFLNILRNFATVWNKLAGTLNKLGGKFGMTTLPTINSYAVGTNYVPEDQLAFIHKGEAVVPAKYNNGGYVPQSNDETNYLLEQVITAINNIEINPYTTVRDVGKASLSYINAKSRQLGESVVV